MDCNAAWAEAFSAVGIAWAIAFCLRWDGGLPGAGHQTTSPGDGATMEGNENEL